MVIGDGKVPVWRSAHNSWNVLSSITWFTGIVLRSLGLAASVHIHWVFHQRCQQKDLSHTFHCAWPCANLRVLCSRCHMETFSLLLWFDPCVTTVVLFIFLLAFPCKSCYCCCGLRTSSAGFQSLQIWDLVNRNAWRACEFCWLQSSRWPECAGIFYLSWDCSHKVRAAYASLLYKLAHVLLFRFYIFITMASPPSTQKVLVNLCIVSVVTLAPCILKL